MDDQSPVDAYLDAFQKYSEVQDDYDDPAFLKQLRSLAAVLETRFQHLLHAAEPGPPLVWHTIGTAYNTGRGIKRDKGEAIRWFQRAADAGFAPAMVNLALCLQRPEPGIDPAGAIRWFRKAADKGYAGGMVWLGFAYREGSGVPCDYTESVQWFIKAVEAGDSHSMIQVGRMYARYLQSPEEAVTWLLRAAKAGLSESYVALALLYDDRRSVVYDPAEAHKWYRVVAEHSEGTSSRALLAIARQHTEGVGVPCDVEMARVWLRRLLQAVPRKSSAHRDASRLLEKLEGQFL